MTNTPVHILVVDDNADMARSTARLLQQAGYVTEMAANGVEALQAVQTFRPHLVLSDRDMPEMDGLELCRRIKTDPALADIFVVLASAAFTRSEEQSAGLDMGADGYIALPIANRELVARVDAVVRILRLNQALREKNTELEAALAKVKVLSGLLPICAGCKKIRDDSGYWSQVDSYLKEHSEVRFTHGMCPDCFKKAISELDKAEQQAAPSPREPGSLIEPEGDIGALELSDIIDAGVMQAMMEDFYRVTGMLGAVLDLSGKVLVAVGWQDLCAKFHRCHPDTLKNCIESDTLLTQGVPPGTFKAYRCKNNMWDMVTPLMVGGRHVGNVYFGQFFYEDETPDVALFRAQARQHGFDEKEYLAALGRVPRFSREKADAGMRFYAKLAKLVSTLSFNAITQSRLLAERARAEEKVLRLHEDLQRHAAELEQRVIERTAELAAAKDRAESADLVKSAFLATMSHELRTPLNSIIGFTGLMLQGLAGPLNAEQTKQLGMVKGSGQHLLALINDVLDISKIEAGQIEIANAPFDLPEAIHKVVQTLTPLADRKHLPLAVRMGPEVGQIVSDRRRVEQVLLNLLGNAIKFTEHGEVTLTAEALSGTLRMSVADTGIGMKPDDLSKLFQPFRQLDAGLTRQHEGTGLGLAICKRLVDRLGGTVSVESHWKKGSTFTVTLPVQPERQS